MRVMKEYRQFYQVDPLRVPLKTSRIGVKSLRNHNLDIHWGQRVDLR